MVQYSIFQQIESIMGKKSRKDKIRKISEFIASQSESPAKEKTPPSPKDQPRIGRRVVVKNGVKDPDYDIDIGGWTGVIYEMDDDDDIEEDDNPLIGIQWDGKTLKKMPKSIIKKCEKDNLDSSTMFLNASEIELVAEEKQKKREKESPGALLNTITNESYMLARIYYDLRDKGKLQRIFSKLRCMDYDKNLDRWVWLYQGEAKKLKFNKPYDKIPRHQRPIVLGSFFSKDDGSMYLNTNSFVRARRAVVFFDKHIPRSVASLADMVVVNKIFGFQGGTPPKHEDYFDKEPLDLEPHEKILEDLIKEAETIKDPTEKMLFGLAKLEEKARRPFPEIESIPVESYYEDGIAGIRLALISREIIAMKHWQGETDYTMNDFMREISENF